MHELGYCESVLDAVLRRAGERPVCTVGVRIGAVHRVAAEAFQQSFAIAAIGTIAADARTEITVVPVRAQCQDCRTEFRSQEPSPACPRCGGLDVTARGGDELVLEWIAYRDASETLGGERIRTHPHQRA